MQLHDAWVLPEGGLQKCLAPGCRPHSELISELISQSVSMTMSIRLASGAGVC